MQNCDTKFKILTISFLMLLGFFGLAKTSLAAIITQDNFDNWPQVGGGDWYCCNDAQSNCSNRNAAPSPWDVGYGYCSALSPGGYTNNTVKIMPGQSGKGIGFCRKSGVGGGYEGDLFTPNDYNLTKFYVRYYLKFPSAMQKDTSQTGTWKFHRHWANPDEAVVYIEGFGSTMQSSEIGFSHANWNQGSGIPVTAFENDFTYFEYMIDSPNNTFKIWYGPYNTENNPAYVGTAATGASYFKNLALGMGNTNIDTDFTNTSWACMVIDDYVASTTWIGPSGDGGDTVPPSAPSGLMVS